MLRTRWIVASFFLTAAPALQAQPFVFHRSVLNAASYAPSGLPSGSLARGSIFSIFGRALGPAATAKADTYPLGTTLAGVSIQVCRDTTCVAVLPIYVSPGQINAILPSNAPLGSATLRITYNNQPGNFAPIEVVPVSVGIFAINSGGFGPGVVQNFVTSTNTPVNSATASAKPGQFAILWATGLGASLNGDTVEPQAGNLPGTVEVFAGGKRARVEYGGRAPCCAGLDQIVFVLPDDAPLGCNVPIAVRAGGIVSNDVTMAITADGQPCSTIDAPTTAALFAGGRLGRVLLTRTATQQSSGDTVTETAYGAFTVELANEWAFHPDFNGPPPGACVTYLSRGSISEISAITTLAPSIRRFDAGPQLTLSVGKEARPVPPRPQNLTGYFSVMGLSSPQVGLAPVLIPGSPATVTVPGGADLGPFEVSITPPLAPEWLNRTSIAAIDRRQDLTITFRPLPARTELWIRGSAIDQVADAMVNFVCRTSPEAGQFTVPAYVLGRMPSYRSETARSAHWLELSIIDSGEAPVPAGLDRLFIEASSGIERSVEYR